MDVARYDAIGMFPVCIYDVSCLLHFMLFYYVYAGKLYQSNLYIYEDIIRITTISRLYKSMFKY